MYCHVSAVCERVELDPALTFVGISGGRLVSDYPATITLAIGAIVTIPERDKNVACAIKVRLMKGNTELKWLSATVGPLMVAGSVTLSFPLPWTFPEKGDYRFEILGNERVLHTLPYRLFTEDEQRNAAIESLIIGR